jgi:hypothetical protein
MVSPYVAFLYSNSLAQEVENVGLRLHVFYMRMQIVLSKQAMRLHSTAVREDADIGKVLT